MSSPRAFTRVSDSGVLLSLEDICVVRESSNLVPEGGIYRVMGREIRALWDTGASCSVISSRIALAMNLSRTGNVVSHHAGGSYAVILSVKRPEGRGSQSRRSAEPIANKGMVSLSIVEW
jgi:hypothetical protein